MEKHKNKTTIYSAALALVALFWGTSYAIIKDSLDSVQPFQLMTIRFGFSAILLSIIFGKRLKSLNKKNVLHSCIIGLFMFGAFFCLVTGISFTTASKQCFIVGAYVLIVPFLAWMINKKKPDTYAVSGAVMAVIGLGLLTLGNSFAINKGDIISIFCSLFFALHMVCIEYFNKDADPIASTIVQFIVTACLFIIFTAVFESFSISFTPKLIRSFSYLIIISTVIAFAVQNVAQKYIS